MPLIVSNLQMRPGRFSLKETYITQLDEAMLLLRLMGFFFICRCEHCWPERRFDYIALSPLFFEVPDGEDIPTYEVTIDAEGRVTATRLD